MDRGGINRKVCIMAIRYITDHECKIRDAALHEKLDMILAAQREYKEEHYRQHEKIDKVLDSYKTLRASVIGGSVVVSALISLALKLWRF